MLRIFSIINSLHCFLPTAAHVSCVAQEPSGPGEESDAVLCLHSIDRRKCCATQKIRRRSDKRSVRRKPLHEQTLDRGDPRIAGLLGAGGPWWLVR